MNTDLLLDEDIDGGKANDKFSENVALIIKAQAGDENAMEKLVIDNTPLVRSIAYKFRDRGTEFEDLIQIGIIGMIKSIRSFEPERGCAFSTYAVPLIVGEIRRHLRDDGLVRVSRSCKRVGISLMREKNRIMSEEGREPSISELARNVGVSQEEAAVAIDAVMPITSLSDNVYGEDSQTYDAIIPDKDSADELEAMTDRIAIGQAINKMPEPLL